jgi:hypothetical protein
LRTFWILLLEEFGVTFEYLPGKKQKNEVTVADDLSRLDILLEDSRRNRRSVNTSLRIRKQQHQ